MPWQGKSPTEQLGLLWGPFNNRPVFDKVSSKYTSCSGELRDFEFAVTGLSTAKKHSSRKQQPASSLLWEAKLLLFFFVFSVTEMNSEDLSAKASLSFVFFSSFFSSFFSFFCFFPILLYFFCQCANMHRTCIGTHPTCQLLCTRRWKAIVQPAATKTWRCS